MHDVDPATGAYEPPPQFKQTVAPLPEYDAAGHVAHEVELVVFWNVPAVQAVHEDDVPPTGKEYDPVGHTVHPEAPLALYVPAKQVTQVVEFVDGWN